MVVYSVRKPPMSAAAGKVHVFKLDGSKDGEKDADLDDPYSWRHSWQADGVPACRNTNPALFCYGDNAFFISSKRNTHFSLMKMHF